MQPPRKYKVTAMIGEVEHLNLVLAYTEQEAIDECVRIYGYVPERVKDLS